MSKLSIPLAIFLLTLYVQTSQACSPPTKPELPNPDTAVTPQMVKAKNDVKAYLDAAEKYLNCNITTSQHNRIVDDMHNVADSFNTIVRSYKKRMSS